MAGVPACDRTGKTPSHGPSIASALKSAKDDAIDLPETKTMQPEPTTAVVHLLLTKTRVSIPADPWPIATVPTDPALGFAAEDKRDGREDLRVTPLAEALEWQSAHADKGAAPSPEASLLVIIADRRTPYRLVSELVASSGMNYRVAFAVRSSDRKKPPGLMIVAGSPPRHVSRDRLDVRVGPEGITIAVGKDSIGAECKELAPGPTIPRVAEQPLDLALLTACMKHIADERKEATTEEVRIGANAELDLATYLTVVESVREAGFEELAMLAPTAKPTRPGQ